MQDGMSEFNEYQQKFSIAVVRGISECGENAGPWYGSNSQYMDSHRFKGLWDLSDRDKIKEEQVSMKKISESSDKQVLLRGYLCAGISVFPASAAGRIQKISLYLEGRRQSRDSFWMIRFRRSLRLRKNIRSILTIM